MSKMECLKVYDGKHMACMLDATKSVNPVSADILKHHLIYDLPIKGKRTARESDKYKQLITDGRWRRMISTQGDVILVCNNNNFELFQVSRHVPRKITLQEAFDSEFPANGGRPIRTYPYILVYNDRKKYAVNYNTGEVKNFYEVYDSIKRGEFEDETANSM